MSYTGNLRTQTRFDLCQQFAYRGTVLKRTGKIYLEYLQNRSGATIAGVYSLPPKPDATVSMPLRRNGLCNLIP
jgi:DNA primase